MEDQGERVGMTVEQVAAHLHRLGVHGDEPPDWPQAVAYSEDENFWNVAAWVEQVSQTRDLAKLLVDLVRDVTGGMGTPEPEAVAARMWAFEHTDRNDPDWEVALRIVRDPGNEAHGSIMDEMASVLNKVRFAFDLMGRPLPAPATV